MNSELKPGSVLDGFRIVEALGRGASSEVFLALAPDGRRVVLKLPRDLEIASPKSFDRFRRELEIAHRLDHPGIHRSLDYRVDMSRPYLVMEYVDGETLAAVLERETRLSVDRAVEYAIQLCEAAACAHDHGVIHRDIKPQNVLVSDGDRLVITDFGIALLDGARRLTWGRFGDRLGTPDYMSPEQIQGKRGDARSDVFAIGAVLFEMLTGRAPWRSDSQMDVLDMHLAAPVPAMAQFGVEVPETIEWIVRRCLRKLPDERYQSAAELGQDLGRWRTLEAGQIAMADEQALRPAEEHLLLLVGGVCLGFLAFAALFVTASYLITHH
jgi:serine/threonine-protein kinase